MVEIKHTQLFINNEFVDSISGKTFATINPKNKKEICQVSEGFKEDVDVAVAAAKKAFERNSEWRTMEAAQRGMLLWKLADEMEANLEHLAELEVTDVGKPITEARGDIGFSIAIYRYYAGYADKIHGKTLPMSGNFFGYTKKQAIGVCGQIIPWNFPVLMQAFKLAPALACGNTIVMKLAEQTPLGGLFVASLIKKVGFPSGVVNMITGYGPTAGAAISEHPDVRKIAFTGSTEVGKIIVKASTVNLKRVSLELGGKSPAIVFNDADLNESCKWTDSGLFSNAGQCCIAASRIFVQEGIYDEYVKKVVEQAKSRKVGDPMDESVNQGPQIDEDQFHKILELIESGKKDGAKVECGGSEIKSVNGESGFFIEPTVFSGVTDDMRIAKEEIFGPVMQILKFKTKEEVIERANETDYGLAAAVFSTNVNTINEMVEALEAGSVWVNTYAKVDTCAPFGGHKMSGIGRELGEAALSLYTEEKTVSMPTLTKNS